MGRGTVAGGPPPPASPFRPCQAVPGVASHTNASRGPWRGGHLCWPRALPTGSAPRLSPRCYYCQKTTSPWAPDPAQTGNILIGSLILRPLASPRPRSLGALPSFGQARGLDLGPGPGPGGAGSRGGRAPAPAPRRAMFTGHRVPKRLPAAGGGVSCRLGAHLPPPPATPFLHTKVLPPRAPRTKRGAAPAPCGRLSGVSIHGVRGSVLQIQKSSLVTCFFFPPTPRLFFLKKRTAVQSLCFVRFIDGNHPRKPF